jgi:hypothetical protein
MLKNNIINIFLKGFNLAKTLSNLLPRYLYVMINIVFCFFLIATICILLLSSFLVITLAQQNQSDVGIFSSLSRDINKTIDGIQNNEFSNNTVNFQNNP